MAKNCNEIREKLSCMVDGLLDKQDELLVHEHLSSCTDCADYYADLTKVESVCKELFGMVKESANRESLWEGIASQIAQEPEGLGSNVVEFVKPARKRRIPLWISSAVAAVLVVLVGFYLYYFMFSKYSKNNCIVTWVESRKNPVMLYKDKSTNTTIIWMFSDVTNS